MLRVLAAITLICAFAHPAEAQQRRNGGNIPTYDSWRAPGPTSRPPHDARPAAGPYDHPTLGDPQPRSYGKSPTLGDPRPFRNTNPRTCTGLLCD